jgi:PAS domain S-box-containing protein
MSSQSTGSPKADILVIDDTPDNLNLLSAMLTEQGYKVRSVTKGTTGLRGAQTAPPDLILLDINMPQMNGYEVCQHLKADDRTRQIPVIFISALEEVLDKVKAFAVGGVDYITKPFQLEEVLARIENHLAIRTLQQQLQWQNTQLQQEIHDRQQAEEKFVKAFRSSPTPISIVSLVDGRFLEVNPSFLRMSGYALEEVLGNTATELKLGIPPEVYDQAIQRLIETGILQNQECEFRSKSGEVKAVLLCAELIDLAGESCALNIVNDITERKRLENEFISLVSHELRTPLTSLMGSLDLLATGQLGSLTHQGQRVLNIAVSNTERLIRLINDILDLERMKSGKITMKKARCNISELLTQATEAMQAMADQVKVKLVIQSLSIELWADLDRILQTLTNLLSNAIKFSPPESTVWLIAERIDTPIPDTEAEAQYSEQALPPPLLNPNAGSSTLRISVRDQGRGIPADQLELIFDRFQQVDASDSREKGGTGLGLSICRNIVEQHHGKIWVESTLGAGSTFYVLLPLHQET